MLTIKYLIATACISAAVFSCTAHNTATTNTTTVVPASTAPRDPLDLDHDGVPNTRDQCPNSPEDRDHVADLDGCPEVDQDCDNIEDSVDSCPEHPEDHDNWQDQDGCPDPDNDGDRIADICDVCPNEVEVYNGRDDEDGCPDTGHIQVSQDIRILEYPYFARNSSSIRAPTLPLMAVIRDTLRGNPQLLQIAVIGHSSSDEPGAVALSQRRAHVVTQWLLDQGISPTRLVERSMGSTRPLDNAATAIGRARNRRVEFVIVQTSERTQSRWNGTAYESVAPTEQAHPVRVRMQPECRAVPVASMRPGGCPLETPLASQSASQSASPTADAQVSPLANPPADRSRDQ